MVDDLLTIGSTADQLELSLEQVNVSELIAEAVENVGPLADAAGVSINHSPGDSDGQIVHADRRRLRQVLLHLLSNAVKFNHRGGHVDVHSETSEQERTVQTVVSDTGPGIPEQDLPRLFVPFDRLGGPAPGVDGTGTGLALPRKLMVLMKGTLRATSRPGVGTTFIAPLP